jgi:hypothetical protein
MVRTPATGVYAFLAIADQGTPANNPVLAESPTLAIRRFSDGDYYDFVSGVWDTVADYASLGVEHLQALTDLDNGGYGFEYTLPSTEDDYLFIYEVPSGSYQGTTQELVIATNAQFSDLLRMATVQLSLAIRDEGTPANDPVTGEAPTVALYRVSDGAYYDFVSGLWDAVADYASLGAEHLEALTDEDDGTYTYAWTRPTGAGVYIAIYEVPAGTYQGMTYDVWAFDTGDPSVSMCRVYFNLAEVEGGEAATGGQGTIDVTDVLERATGNVTVWHPGEVSAQTDADGLVFVDVPQEFTIALRVSWPGRTRELTLEVPALAQYDLGADLQD